MDRSERLDRSFMEPPEEWNQFPTVIAQRPTHPMPDEETARSQTASMVSRSRKIRWMVEFMLGPDEARERYPEAYGIFE